MSKGKILIVEDEALTFMLYEMDLANKGYAIYGPAISGQEAIDMALEIQPDIILMDIGLTGAMDGIEAARRIKRQRANISILFATGYADEETRLRADRAVDHDGYLIKPMDMNELASILEVTLEKRKTPGDTF